MIDVLRILWPTDFGETSNEAGKYAFTLADQFAAELHALHVVQDLASSLPESATLMASFPNSYMTQVQELAEEQLAADLPSDFAGGKEVVRVIKVGSPLTKILDYAQDHDIDLIVMGTHGRTGLPHFLIGSVAERVVRHAPCPVLTVRPTADQNTASSS